MKILKLNPILFCLFLSQAHGAETDQFIAWGQEIQDSKDAFNDRFNGEIRHIVAGIPGMVSCQEATRNVARGLYAYSIFRKKSQLAFNDKFFFPAKADLEAYRNESLYGGESSKRYFLANKISRSFKTGGVLHGTDKINHFLSFGAVYLRIYQQKLAQGASEEEAVRRAIRLGLGSERRAFGFLTTGTFSFADLDANYQGFRFYRSLCEGEKPLLEKRNGKWKVTHDVDMTDYINPKWDESFNTSAFLPRRWEKIRPRLKKYCSWLDSDWLKERNRQYQAKLLPDGINEAVIQEAIEAGEIPNQKDYSLETVCAE